MLKDANYTEFIRHQEPQINRKSIQKFGGFHVGDKVCLLKRKDFPIVEVNPLSCKVTNENGDIE